MTDLLGNPSGAYQLNSQTDKNAAEPKSGTSRHNRQMIFLLGGLAVTLLALITCAFFFLFSGSNPTTMPLPTRARQRH